MSAAADLEGGLRAYLLTVAALQPLVDGWIFGGELPADRTAQMPRKALVIRKSGGVSTTGGSFVETDTARVDLFSFGETPHEAGRVMAEAELAMRRLRRGVHGGCLLHSANSAGGAIAGREPGTEWPRQFQSFQVKYGLVQVGN